MWTKIFLSVLFIAIVHSSTIRYEIPRRFEKSLDNDQVVKNAVEIPNVAREEDDSSDSSESDEDDENYDGPRAEGGGAYFTDDNGELIYAQFNGENPGMAFKSADKKNIKFFLYTKGSEQQQLLLDDLDTITKSTYDPKHLTKILIHGFTNSVKSEFVQILKDTYLQYFNYNIIVVDWSRLSGAPWYYSASKNTMRTGKYTAELITILVNKFKAKLSNFHIIGHSLGAHTGGIVSKHLTAVPGKIHRITGLDPALPLYSSAAKKWLLTTEDADFVDVIHTSGGNLGFMDPMGHGDFYPNGGVAPQPGCGFDLTASCSHSRSWEYFGETIANEVAFPTKECDDLKQAQKGKCNADRDITPNMGEKAYKDEELETGLYYTKTLKKKPYAINSY